MNLEMDRPYFNHADTILVTTNYYYSTRDCIGQGASSCVYKGQHRVTGEEMALKVSKQIGLHREVERELEAFLILRHKNIVTFYGVEEDVQSGKHVIVMEYCSGGSLFSFLQEPENKRGLSDQEFLILLKHLRRAIEKLNSCGFIHRDIKPGNVLRAIDRTGKSIYKISDFGSARQLESDDHCVSLAGTEEYLHPHVYDKAFINRSPMIIYKHSMDRWSLGATLCHAATGDVPFKPCGGARKNRAVMFHMVSQKPSGKIRCIQEKTSGKIIWFDELPVDCNMTEGLRARVVPIIAGLMEKDEHKQWTNITFIHEVDSILESVVMYILNTDTCKYHTLYMEPENTFPYISESIAAQTEIQSARQIYFINNQPKDCIVSSSVRVKELPSTSEDKPLICVFLTDYDESIFNQLVEKCTFSDVFILSEDCKVSSDISVNIHAILKRVTESVQAQKALVHFAKDYRSYMNRLVETIETDFTKDVMILTEKQTRFRQITETVSISGTTKDSSLNLKCQNLSNKELEIKKVIEFIKCEICEIKRLQQTIQENDDFLQFKLCSNDCISEIEYVFKQAKEVVKCMCKRRKNSCLTHMEEVRHKNDKKKMVNFFDSSSRHWKSCCNTKSQKLSKCFKNWMRYQNKVQGKLENVKEHIVYLQSISRSFNNELTTFSAYSGRDCSMMVSSEKWKNLLRRKDDSADILIEESRCLMKSLSLALQNSCLNIIGDVKRTDSIHGT